MQTEEMSVSDKIKLVREQIRLLTDDAQVYSVQPPTLVTDYEEGDEAILSEDKLLEYHKQLEDHLLVVRKFRRQEKKGFDGFLEAWRKQDQSHPFVDKILSHKPAGFWEISATGRDLNPLYHPRINYDKNPMPQVYALIQADQWNEIAA